STGRAMTKIGIQELSSTAVDRPLFTTAAGRSQAHAATSRDVAIDTLRSFCTVLVVAHHALLAYALISPDVTARGPFPWLTGIPIVDSHRLIGFDVWALFDDTCLMTLM